MCWRGVCGVVTFLCLEVVVGLCVCVAHILGLYKCVGGVCVVL